MRTCHDRLVADGVSVSSYNMDAEVSDVTDYVYAAGLDQVFMTSVSQDSPAVLVAADRFPGTFRGIILDNPIDPADLSLDDPVADLATAFSRLARLCLDDVVCAPQHPHLLDDAKALFAKLNVSPQRITVTSQRYQGRYYPLYSEQKFEVVVDGTRLTEGLLRAIVLPGTYSLIPLVIGNATLDAAASFAIGGELGDYNVDPAALSYLCSARADNAGDQFGSAAASPWFAAAADPTLAQRCQVWDVPTLPQEFFSPPSGRTPTFIAVGDLNPTPALVWAQDLQRSRSNTTVIDFTRLGAFLGLSGGQGIPCYHDLLQAFVLDPTTTLDVAGCAAQQPPVAFAG